MIQVQNSRDAWLFEGAENVIGFYPREFYCLDNFSSFKVLYNGILYSSVEEAYQSLKFVHTAPDISLLIRNSYSAHEAMTIAHDHRESQAPNWNDIKLDIMEELLRLKTKQNPYVLKKLLLTGNCLIVEDSPKDNFWGWGEMRNGENHLGKLWMKLRAEFRDPDL